MRARDREILLSSLRALHPKCSAGFHLTCLRFNSNKSAADKVKDAAKEFKADGKIGSKFTSEGEVGKKFDQEVGGVFAKGKIRHVWKTVRDVLT